MRSASRGTCARIRLFDNPFVSSPLGFSRGETLIHSAFLIHHSSFIIIFYLCHPQKIFMKKTISLLLFVLAIAASGLAQTVYQKDRWGAKLYYMQENTIRLKDRWGEQLLWYDAASQQVRLKDRWGQPLLYMDGQTVRLKDRWGDPLLYFDGLTIRQKDRWGTPLYYLDGQTLRLKDRWGAAVYYFDFIPDKWQIACLVLM